MDMREKVIKWLETCINGCDDTCPYKRECESKGGFIEPMTDALTLLKEDERAIKFQSDRLDALLKAKEPRTCSECRHYDTNAFTDMGGRCRNSRSCHYCYGCDKSFGCNAWEGR